MSTGSALVALVVDGHAELLAQRLELVDGRRTVDVAGHHGRGSCPAASRKLASLPQAVVLPEPCRPTIMMTVGGRGENVSLVEADPMRAVSSSLTILMNCCAGVRLSSTSAPKRALLDLVDELLDDLVVDVGLEQGQADLAGSPLDVFVRELALPLEAVKAFAAYLRGIRTPVTLSSAAPHGHRSATALSRAANEGVYSVRGKPPVKPAPAR